MAAPLFRRRRRSGKRRWNPLQLTGSGSAGSPLLGAWYSGASVVPQSVAALSGWNDEGPNNYDLGTAVNTPAVIAAGSSFAGEFIRNATAANSEYVHASGLTITASSSGGMWAVFALRSGASTAAFHTLLAIGSTTTVRGCELDLHPVSSALYPGFYCLTGSDNAFARSTTSVSGTGYHSVLFEADSTANTYRIWLNGTETATVTGVAGGEVGDWLSDWTGAPSRLAIGIGIRNGTVAEGGDVKVFDTGFYHGTLGNYESNVLGHLQRKRVAAA